MKMLFCALIASLVLAACGNSGNGTASGSSPDSPTTQYRGVENVNGNIPDTAATGAEPGANLHSDSAH